MQPFAPSKAISRLRSRGTPIRQTRAQRKFLPPCTKLGRRASVVEFIIEAEEGLSMPDDPAGRIERCTAVEAARRAVGP